jgi:hypothetical protein
MGFIPDPTNNLTITSARASAAFAANANVTGIDLRGYQGKVSVVFNIGASTAGTSPTYDASLQSGTASDGSNATAFSPAIAITQATGASFQVLTVDTRVAARYLKIVQTIGGTSSPSFPVSIQIIGTKKTQ